MALENYKMDKPFEKLYGNKCVFKSDIYRNQLIQLVQKIS